ncbi:UNVERIFIED_CONTAM: hypothetical protein Sangu_2622300 [Sesamum angustifolium]|uniref:RNase H type-1 domain-containing protein n=1 Tax=Sesamum angustifolium TaxID=2727405 RepID=A0AAW2J4Y5_9LAMI
MARNVAKYRGVPFSTDGIIFEVQRHLRILYAARTLTSTQWKGDLHQAAVMGFIFRQQVPRALSILHWHAPSPSWFKLNTDGSSLGNPGDQCAGRAHCCLAGDGACPDPRSCPLVVEVDATTVISLLKSRASGKWEIQHMIMRIVCLQQFLMADVQHVFREANGAADHLANEAASLQLT